MNTTTHTPAYDYAAQVWLAGPAADAERIRQLREEQALLTGPTAVAYAAFIGCPDLAGAVAELEAELATIEDPTPAHT